MKFAITKKTRQQQPVDRARARRPAGTPTRRERGRERQRQRHVAPGRVAAPGCGRRARSAQRPASAGGSSAVASGSGGDACASVDYGAIVRSCGHFAHLPDFGLHCAMPSFDVVSKVDLMELDNALNTARKELGQRYDFRGTNTDLERGPEGIVIRSSDEPHAARGADRAARADGQARRLAALPGPQGRRGGGRPDGAPARSSSSRGSRWRRPRRS